MPVNKSQRRPSLAKQWLQRRLFAAIDEESLTRVRIYIALGADPNLVGDYKLHTRITPFFFALNTHFWPPKKIRTAIVEFLVTFGKADVNAVDKYGVSAFWRALYYRDEYLVRAFLATGKIDVNAIATGEHHKGIPPICFAALHGDYGLTKILLNTGQVDVNAIVTEGQFKGTTALWLATNRRKYDTVSLLLTADNIDVNAAPSEDSLIGQTPLWLAAANFSGDSVRRLLATGKAYVNATDSEGKSVLWMAVFVGAQDIVKMLLENAAVDIHRAPSFGEFRGVTPYQLAIDRNEIEIFKQFLATNKLNVNAAPTKGNVKEPLLVRAVYTERAAIVDLLLDNNEVDVNATATGHYREDIYSLNRATSLWLAVLRGNIGIVKKLLATGKVNVNAGYDERACHYLTPFMFAIFNANIKNRHEIIMELLATDKVDVNATPASGQYMGRISFINTILQEDIDLVRLLFATNKINFNAMDMQSGLTPLLTAISTKNAEMFDMLLATKQFDINAMPNEGQYTGVTPLAFAARQCATEIVERILARQDVKIDLAPESGKNQGCTPLLWAAYAGSSSIIALLLATNKVNVNAKGLLSSGFETPLSIAVRRNNLFAVQILIAAQGVDVNVEVNWGMGAGRVPIIFVAAAEGDLAIFELLLNAGADTEYLKQKLFRIGDSRREKIHKMLALAIAKTSSNLQEIAACIVVAPKPPIVYTPETSEHDISFAKATYAKVCKYFGEHNIQQPAYEQAFAIIRDLIANRILAESDTKLWMRDLIRNKRTATGIPAETLIPYINRTNVNHKAYEWIMTFNQRMIYINTTSYAEAADLMRNMLCAIIAARDDLIKMDKQQQATDIEDALIIQLDNAMDGNEGTMSCAPGTPRFFRVVLQAYLDIVAPEYKPEFSAATNVIDNLLREYFKQIIAKYDNIDTNWKQIIDELITACEALAGLGLDNAQAVINGDVPTGRFSGAPYDATRLKLRSKIMYTTYPNTETFLAAIKQNLNYDAYYIFPENERLYYNAIFLAISDTVIRERLYQSLDNQIEQLSKQRALLVAEAQLAELIKQYDPHGKPGQPNISKAKLVNMLVSLSKLFAGDNFNLEEITDNVMQIVARLNSPQDPEAIPNAQAIIEELQARYQPSTTNEPQPQTPRLRPS